MAVIDRLKFDGLRSRDWIVYKHPSEDLVCGTQLIVAEGQKAIFVKGGEICDLFNPGTYTLNTQNLPILQSIVNIPFGRRTPFTAEVFYLNTLSKLDLNWGTSDPIQIIDPKYLTRLRIRAFGQIGLKISEPRQFLHELIGMIGASDVVRYDIIIEFFKGLLVQKIKTIIADIIINQKISALEITAKLDNISEIATNRIFPEFDRFGMSVVNFFIKSVNFPEEDFAAINEILKNRAEFEIMGDSRYVAKRSFDVYESAAGNEGGLAGTFAAGGIGLGVGAAVGREAMGTLNTGASLGSEQIPCPSCGVPNDKNSKFCRECGKPVFVPKPRCPSCGFLTTPETKYCPQCGVLISGKSCECGASLPMGAKFCPECSKPVE